MTAFGPRWRFTDPVTTEEYIFEISPVEGGEPRQQKNIVFKNTSGPNGNVIAYEGRDQVQEVSITGTLLTEDQHEKFKEWYDKRYQIQVTTDLGETFTIYITAYEPTRLRAYNHPHRRRYTIRYFILDWVSE